MLTKARLIHLIWPLRLLPLSQDEEGAQWCHFDNNDHIIAAVEHFLEVQDVYFNQEGIIKQFVNVGADNFEI